MMNCMYGRKNLLCQRYQESRLSYRKIRKLTLQVSFILAYCHLPSLLGENFRNPFQYFKLDVNVRSLLVMGATFLCIHYFQLGVDFNCHYGL